MTIQQQKKALRKRILAARNQLAPEERARRAAAIRERLQALPLWQEADLVHLFAPFGSEVDTCPLYHALWAEGRQVVLPRVAPGRQLEHCLATEEADLEPGAWSIPEPARHCIEISPGDVTLILVPGVAFDRQGGRLGYGGGYYDRFLDACPAPRVALAFGLQLVDAVPRAAHDRLVHAVVTEAEVVIVDPDRVAPPRPPAGQDPAGSAPAPG